MGRDRLSSIQVLRGVAVIAVVTHHAVEMSSNGSMMATGARSPVFANIACLGASGVDLFFVISGFVMANVADRHREGGAGRFLVDRLIRIVPMFWLVSASYAAWMARAGGTFSVPAYLNTLSIIPFAGADQLPVLYVGWTLAFELVFYLVAMTVIAAGTARPARWLMIVTALAAALGYSARLHAILPLLLNPIVGEFALGAAAWLVWRGARCGISPLALILFGALMLSQTLIDPWTPGFSVHPALVESGATSMRRLILWGVPCSLIVLGAASTSPNKGLGIRAFRRIGDASYSVYLSHLLAFGMLASASSRWPLGQVPLAAAFVVTALMFGWGVHVVIERPLLDATRRGWASFKRGIDHQRSPATT